MDAGYSAYTIMATGKMFAIYIGPMIGRCLKPLKSEDKVNKETSLKRTSQTIASLNNVPFAHIFASKTNPNSHNGGKSHMYRTWGNGREESTHSWHTLCVFVIGRKDRYIEPLTSSNQGPFRSRELVYFLYGGQSN